MTKEQDSVISLFMKDLSSLGDDFCDEKSEMRKNYTKFAPCLRSVQQKYQRDCVTDLQAGFESIHKLNYKVRLPTVCWLVSKNLF